MWCLLCLHQFLERKSRAHPIPPSHRMYTKWPRDDWSLYLTIIINSGLVTCFLQLYLPPALYGSVGPRSALSLNNILNNILTSLVVLSSIILLLLIILIFSFSHYFSFYVFFSLLKNNLRELNGSGIQWIILNLSQQADFCLDQKISYYRLTKASYDQDMLVVLHNITLNCSWRKMFIFFYNPLCFQGILSKFYFQCAWDPLQDAFLISV